jgi:hypothetical protein
MSGVNSSKFAVPTATLPAFTADRAAFVPFYGVIPNGPVKESSMRSVCAIAQALGRVKMSAPPGDCDL